eukprot:2861601-Prymnesium_polylepis.1
MPSPQGATCASRRRMTTTMTPSRRSSARWRAWARCSATPSPPRRARSRRAVALARTRWCQLRASLVRRRSIRLPAVVAARPRCRARHSRATCWWGLRPSATRWRSVWPPA